MKTLRSPLLTIVALATLALANPSAGADLRSAQAAFRELSPDPRHPGLRYLLRAGSLEAGLGDGELLLKLTAPAPVDGVDGVLLRITFPGARAARPMGTQVLPGAQTVFRQSGGDLSVSHQRRWKTVEQADLLPGIDLVYRSDRRGLKYDLRVAPGADLSSLAFRVEGADSLRLDGGELVFATAVGELRDAPPVGEENGLPVDCSYRLIDETAFGFDCPGWSGRSELVVDPLVYSTLMGGDEWDQITDLVLDESGRAVVTGWTESVDFPTTPGAFREDRDQTVDAFVARFSADGSVLEWSTLIGGRGEDWGEALVIAPSGDILVTGQTRSLAFPTTPGSFQPVHGGGGLDAFVLALSDSGDSLKWSTYLGGNDFDWGHDLAVDRVGRVFVTGKTQSVDFPVTAGAFDEIFGGGVPGDAFVACVGSDGSTLEWATFLGGSHSERAEAIALDGADVLVVGFTQSADFPTTVGALDETLGSDVPPTTNTDAFVTRLDGTGSALLWSTFLGGSGHDEARDLVVDPAGNVVVVGATGGAFPLTPGAPDTTTGGTEAFVAKLNAGGSELVFSTYLGGRAADVAIAVAVDARCNIAVGGRSDSVDFPITPDAFDPTNEVADAFLTVLDPAGTTFLTSTFLGGPLGSDMILAVAIDSDGAYVLGGRTLSSAFPTTPGAYQELSGGELDGFVVKLDLGPLGDPDQRCGAPPEGTCPHTQGFWKTHPDAWPLTELELGDDSYPKDELLALLWTPPRGDASLILAHQLIAAELNVAVGVDPGEVATAIAQAHDLLDRPGRLPLGVPSASPDGQAMVSVAQVLTSFNEGAFTGACEDLQVDRPRRRSDRPSEAGGLATRRPELLGGHARRVGLR